MFIDVVSVGSVLLESYSILFSAFLLLMGYEKCTSNVSIAVLLLNCEKLTREENSNDENCLLAIETNWLNDVHKNHSK